MMACEGADHKERSKLCIGELHGVTNAELKALKQTVLRYFTELRQCEAWISKGFSP